MSTQSHYGSQLLLMDQLVINGLVPAGEEEDGEEDTVIISGA